MIFGYTEIFLEQNYGWNSFQLCNVSVKLSIDLDDMTILSLCMSYIHYFVTWVCFVFCSIMGMLTCLAPMA